MTRPVLLAALLWAVACGGETAGGASSLAPGGGGQSGTAGGGGVGTGGLAGKAGHAGGAGSTAQYPVGAYGQPILPDAERPCSACIRDFHSNGPHTKECAEGIASCRNVVPSCGPYFDCRDTTACYDALNWDRGQCFVEYCPQPTDVASYPKGCNDCDACADACPHICKEMSGSPSLTPTSIYRETTADCKKCVGELGVGEFALKSCAGSPAAAECLQDPLCGGMVKCMAESGCVMAHDEPYDGLSRCVVRHCPRVAAPSLDVNLFESCLFGGCEEVCGL